MSADLAGNCVADFRKYSNTVAVSSAISHLFQTDTRLGHFIGSEHRLLASSPDETLTPDITAVYDGDSRGLLFELKYSLPTDIRSVKEKLLNLAKYSRVRNGWGVKGPVHSADFVLVCHVEDVKRAVDAAGQVFAETQDPFYDPKSFSIWYWTISTPRENERKEEMRLVHAYGGTRNSVLQQLIGQPGGIPIPEDVLMMLRFTNLFIREKPPVQYTIVLLIQNVFSALPPPHRIGRRYYEVSLDLIYQKANSLFPPWWEDAVETRQVKRGWIKEALDTLVKLQMVKGIPQKRDSYSVPIPTLVIRKPLHEAICQRLISLKKARRRASRASIPKRVPSKRPLGVRPLTEFLENRK